MSAPDFSADRDKLEAAFGSQGEIVMPTDAQAPILTGGVRAALHQWLYEMNAEQDLLDVGLKPRNRCMLSGPPGCGKTTLAHHVAARLGLPMLVIQSHEIIGMYFGQSGGRIAKLFKDARRTRNGVALFFDEFDALAKKREGLGSSGADNERHNITIALLQEFDRFDGLLFAATNVTKGIDPAIWRRFQMQIEIGFPGPAERFAIVKMYMAPFACADATLEVIAGAMAGASPALIREACEAIKRSIVLGPKMSLPTDLPSIMDRFGNSASAADGMPEPRLWTERRAVLSELGRAEWPPQRA